MAGDSECTVCPCLVDTRPSPASLAILRKKVPRRPHTRLQGGETELQSPWGLPSAVQAGIQGSAFGTPCPPPRQNHRTPASACKRWNSQGRPGALAGNAVAHRASPSPLGVPVLPTVELRREWLCARRWGGAGGRNLSQLRCQPLGSFRACEERPAVIRADDTGCRSVRGV